MPLFGSMYGSSGEPAPPAIEHRDPEEGGSLSAIERLAYEPQRLFGAAPGERYARAAVAVVVDARRALGYVLYFEPDLGSSRPQTHLVLEYLGLRDARFEGRAAAQDGRRGLWVWLGVPLSFFGRAAKDAVP
jgi:hypothetical protein